jgi:hypothetical protein
LTLMFLEENQQTSRTKSWNFREPSKIVLELSRPFPTFLDRFKPQSADKSRLEKDKQFKMQRTKNVMGVFGFRRCTCLYVLVLPCTCLYFGVLLCTQPTSFSNLKPKKQPKTQRTKTHKNQQLRQNLNNLVK